jgi:putative membrane protein
MKTLRPSLILALTMALVTSIQCQADDRNTQIDPSDFLTKTVVLAQKEFRLSELAQKQSSNESVRQFAQAMINVHERYADQLSLLAKNHRASTAPDIETTWRPEYDRLSKLQGREFDKEYMEQMLKDHRQAIEMFEAQSKTVIDQNLKSCVQEVLPTLRKNLHQAKDIVKTLK